MANKEKAPTRKEMDKLYEMFKDEAPSGFLLPVGKEGKDKIMKALRKIRGMEEGGKVGPTPRPKPGDLNESMGRMIDPQPVRRATIIVNQKGPKSRPKRSQDKKTLSGQFLNLIKEMIDDASDTSPITMKKGGAAFPDLTGDGKVTKKDILRGRGVPGFKRGGAASNVCRGGGAALRGTRFRGVK